MALIDGHFEASVMKHPGQGISFGWACGINLVQAHWTVYMVSSVHFKISLTPVST